MGKLQTVLLVAEDVSHAVVQGVKAAPHAVIQGVKATPRVVATSYRNRRNGFYAAIDSESMVPFQTMYYYIFIVAGVYLIFLATEQVQAVEPVMGDHQYIIWCWLNIVCPTLSLVGRWVYKRAAGKAPGENNASVAASVLQLTGDFGIWWTVNIYLICFIQTTEFGSAVYGVFFCFMGFPGGFMFTLRSLRRLEQIRHKESLLRQLPTTFLLL